MIKLWFDTETYSDVPIKHGTDKYMTGVEPLLVTYAIDDGEEEVWDISIGEEIPPELEAALEDPSVMIFAHNVPFDRQVAKKLGYDIPNERWYDTSIQAREHSLPGSLGTVGKILGLKEDEAKIADGKRLIKLFCCPPPKNVTRGRATPYTHPEDWQAFREYAKFDIKAMRAIHRVLPKWNHPLDISHPERQLWLLDQKINARGVRIDMDLVHHAIRATDEEKARLRIEISDKTNGEVESATKRDKLLEHILKDYGIALPDLKSSTIERRLEDPDIPEGVKELLRIRLDACAASLAKYKALQRSTVEGRLRWSLQFAGAGRTARWAGRIFQPQNLPKPKIPVKEIEPDIEILKMEGEDLLITDVIASAVSAIRGVVIPDENRKLVVSDLSNIEGRAQAWLAGEDWKLAAFRAFDAGKGHDLYALAYAKSFGVPPESVMADKKAGGNQRQVGKVQELALGYEGGVGAFVNFATIYKIDLEDLAVKARDQIPPEVWEEAESFYHWMVKQGNNTYGLSKDVFIVCDSLKRLWRAAHSNIAPHWKEIEEAAIQATLHPGKLYTTRKLKFRRDGSWLRMQLPSGRSLCYLHPRVDANGKLSYMGLNQYTRKWTRIHTHGGKMFENACQAISRDVMGYNMQDIEDDGFEIVLTVHDEVVTYAPDTPEYTADRLSAHLARNKPWSAGLPLAAAGHESYRYAKEA